MTPMSTSVAGEFVEAILARDLSRARGLLHPDIDFRAMTPKRIWEADGPAGVEEVLRAWFEHPERDVERVDPTDQTSIEDTFRVGWRVRGNGVDGPFLYEQQAYVREEDGQIVWLRVICTGPRPRSPAARRSPLAAPRGAGRRSL
jgi:ketosteroid isomerase-like protein